MAVVTCVIVDDGSSQDGTGDEVREWYVTACDDDGEQVEGTRQVTCSNEVAAMQAAERMAAEFGGVEVVTA